MDTLLCIDSLNLMPGHYFLSVWLGALGPIFYDSIDRCSILDVEEADFYGSGRASKDKSVIMMMPCHWECRGLAENAENQGWSVQSVRESDGESLQRL